MLDHNFSLRWLGLQFGEVFGQKETRGTAIPHLFFMFDAFILINIVSLYAKRTQRSRGTFESVPPVEGASVNDELYLLKPQVTRLPMRLRT